MTGASRPNACPMRSSRSATDALVDELRTFSPLAQRTAKKLLNDTEDASLSIAIELEGHCYSRLRQSDDFREGVEAFHAKRAGEVQGKLTMKWCRFSVGGETSYGLIEGETRAQGRRRAVGRPHGDGAGFRAAGREARIAGDPVRRSSASASTTATMSTAWRRSAAPSRPIRRARTSATAPTMR